MARTKKVKQAKTIVHEHFKTLEKFMVTMQDRPLNAAFKGERDEVSSMRDETYKKESGRKSWAGTYTYNEAEAVLLKGYKEPLEKMKTAILKIGENAPNARPRIQNDFIGFAPNVPNAINNIPLNMINRHKVAPKAKTIHLTYSICAAAKTTTNDMIKGGIMFISLVNSLEKQGYRVKIDVIFSTIENGTAAAVTVTLKDYDQQTNLLKLAFPLVHPSMLRRFCFKWLETTPELREKGFVYGYGLPLNFAFNQDLKRERDFLKDNGILKGDNSYYCNVYEAIRAKNIEALAERMEITK
jgi:hypothetical protein